MGHKYTAYVSAGVGTCDCGDPAYWDPRGFCGDHGKTKVWNIICLISKIFF